MTAPRLYLRCSCHAAYHFISIEPNHDIAGGYAVCVVSTAGSFIWRLRRAWRFLWGGELVEADVLLDSEERARLVAFLSDGPPPPATEQNGALP